MAEDLTRDIRTTLCRRLAPAGGARHGLVVGIETYHDPRLNLRCARADATAMYQLMVDPECGVFPPENVRLLLDAEATKDKLWRALAGFRRSLGENDTLWIYYAGHAAQEGSSCYWVTHDADVDDLYGTALANDQIAKVLGDIAATRLLVFLDCCHAAAAVQKNPTRSVLAPEEAFAAYQGKGRLTLSASDGKEKSVELADVGHGAFTYFLTKGLLGEADLDGDGVVTAAELWNYLRRQVTDASTRAGNRQTPILMGEMSHDLALTLNSAVNASKRNTAMAIEAMLGLKEHQLTTDEARFCMDLLSRGPRSQPESVVLRELDRLAQTHDAATVKLLIAPMMRSSPARIRVPASAPARGRFMIRSVFEKPVLPSEETLCRFAVEFEAQQDAGPTAMVPSHLCMVLDLSGSMRRDSKYELLREAIRQLLAQKHEGLYLSVVAFSQGAEAILLAQPLSTIDAESLLARIDRSAVKFGLRTELAAGLAYAANLCRQFSAKLPGSVNRVYVMTDGRVHDRDRCPMATQQFIAAGVELHAFGFGPDYDYEVLRLATKGCVGGTVKVIRDLPAIKTSFARAGETTSNIVATGARLEFRVAPGVLCNRVFLFRPKELDASESISSDSTVWSCSQWANLERDRRYSVLFEVRLPCDTASGSRVGRFTIAAQEGQQPVFDESAIDVARSCEAAACRGHNEDIAKAFDCCEYQNSNDPALLLKAAVARRDLFRLEGRDPLAIQDVEKLIARLKTSIADADADKFMLTPLEEGVEWADAESCVISLDFSEDESSPKSPPDTGDAEETPET
jgi:uncharacterized caspase-like protein